MGEELYISEFQVAESDIAQAKSMCSFYTDENIRKKAFCSYIALGTFIDYIKRLGLEISPHTSISRVMKIVEDFDLSNISYKDLQLDIRVSIESDYIFIPKNHLYYGIAPDIYIGAKLSKDLHKIEFLGYINASQLEDAPLNDDGFYYLKKEQLNPFENLLNALQENSTTAVYYDESECEQVSELFLKYFDGDLTQTEKIYLIKHLMSCLECKCRFIDFYEFDILMKKYKDYKDIYTEFQQDEEKLNNLQAQAQNLFFEEIENTVENNTANEDFTADTEPVAEDIVVPPVTPTADIIQDFAETSDISENLLDKSEQIDDLLNTDEDLLKLSDEDNLLISDDIDNIKLDTIEDIETNRTETKSILRKTTQPEENKESEETEEKQEVPEISEIVNTSEEEEEEEEQQQPQQPQEEVLQNQNDENELNFESNDIENVLDFTDNDLENDFDKNIEEEQPITENKQEETVYQEIEIDSIETENTEKNTILTDDIFEIKEDEQSEPEEIAVQPEESETIDEITIIEEETLPQEEITEINETPEPQFEETFQQDEIPTSNEQIKELYQKAQINQIPREIEDAISHKKGMSPILKYGLSIIAILVIVGVSATLLPISKKPAENNAPIEQEKMEDLSGLETQNPTGFDETQEPVEEPANSGQNMNKAMTSGFSGYNSMIISKISWSVSPQIAQITQVKNYLQAVGKDIQVNLQNDLDNAADFSYNDKIKVGMTIAQNGKVKSIKILNGSGSPEIDKIVKSSITQTIEERNFPVIPEIKGDTNFNLIITF